MIASLHTILYTQVRIAYSSSPADYTKLFRFCNDIINNCVYRILYSVVHKQILKASSKSLKKWGLLIVFILHLSLKGREDAVLFGNRISHTKFTIPSGRIL